MLILILWAGYLEYTDVLNYQFQRHDWGGDHNAPGNCNDTVYGFLLNDTRIKAITITWYGGCMV